MCGIHGFCWKDNNEAMMRMLTLAQHRGPDGFSSWDDDKITLGHNLLAITAKSNNASQPRHYGDYVLLFNGEVYNHKRLRKELSGPFRAESDTETLAVGLAQVGVEFLYRVDGMFALAFYNKATGDLILARDTNGAKPLYYGYLGNNLAFSSEIKSLLSLGFPRRVSKEGFKHYYHAGLVAGRLTLFEGINRLLPGEVIQTNVIRGGETRINLNNQRLSPYDGDPAVLPEMLRDRLRRAVDTTYAETKPVGLFLSGGMDSSTILHELAAGLNKRIATFSTRFEVPHPKSHYNEDADVARQLARTYRTKHSDLCVTEQSWINDFELAIAALEEPRQGKSYPAYYAMNRLLKQKGIVVTLSGDGGDELLMGYKHQRDTPFKHKLASLRAGHRILENKETHITVDEQYDYLLSWIPSGGLTGDAINDFMYMECLHTLSEDFLVRNDKLGMAFGMESRFPMMSKIFRDFVRSIPSQYKVAGPDVSGGWDLTNKWLLRQAYSDSLPAGVIDKKKTGWRAPTDTWLIGMASQPAPDDGLLRNYIRSVLHNPVIRELFELTEDDIENKYLNNRDHFGPLKPSGKPSAGIGLSSQKELFTVLMFAGWFKEFNMCLW